MHLSLDASLSVCRGELSPAHLLREAHRHLVEECPDCRREWSAAREATGAETLFPLRSSPGAGGLRPLPAERWRWRPSDLTARLELLSRLREERRRARADLARLLRQTPAGRQETFRTARTRFASPALAEMLLEASRERLPSDTADAANLAGLVPEVLARMPRRQQDAEWARTLAAQATAQRDEALRIAGAPAAGD